MAGLRSARSPKRGPTAWRRWWRKKVERRHAMTSKDGPCEYAPDIDVLVIGAGACGLAAAIAAHDRAHRWPSSRSSLARAATRPFPPARSPPPARAFSARPASRTTGASHRRSDPHRRRDRLPGPGAASGRNPRPPSSGWSISSAPVCAGDRLQACRPFGAAAARAGVAPRTGSGRRSSRRRRQRGIPLAVGNGAER